MTEDNRFARWWGFVCLLVMVSELSHPPPLEFLFLLYFFLFFSSASIKFIMCDSKHQTDWLTLVQNAEKTALLKNGNFILDQDSKPHMDNVVNACT